MIRYYWTIVGRTPWGGDLNEFGEKEKQPESFSSARMLRTLESYPAQLLVVVAFNSIRCHSRTSNEHSSDAVASRLGMRHLTVKWWSEILQLYSVFQSVARRDVSCRRWTFQRSFCTLARIFFFPSLVPARGVLPCASLWCWSDREKLCCNQDRLLATLTGSTTTKSVKLLYAKTEFTLQGCLYSRPAGRRLGR